MLFPVNVGFLADRSCQGTPPQGGGIRLCALSFLPVLRVFLSQAEDPLLGGQAFSLAPASSLPYPSLCELTNHQLGGSLKAFGPPGRGGGRVHQPQGSTRQTSQQPPASPDPLVKWQILHIIYFAPVFGKTLNGTAKFPKATKYCSKHKQNHVRVCLNLFLNSCGETTCLEVDANP